MSNLAVAVGDSFQVDLIVLRKNAGFSTKKKTTLMFARRLSQKNVDIRYEKSYKN